MKRLSFLIYLLAPMLANATVCSPSIMEFARASNIIRFQLYQSEAGTAPGELLSGLTHDTASLEIRVIAGNVGSDWIDEYTVAGTDDVETCTVGTWSAPTAGKIRFCEVGDGLYELQPEDSVFATTNARSLLFQFTDASDAATLLDDSCEVYIDPITSMDTGLRLGPLAIAAVNSPTEFEIPEGDTNDDAYLDHEFCVLGGTEWGCSPITAYEGLPTPTVTIAAGKLNNYTVQVGDIFRIRFPIRGGLASAAAATSIQTNTTDIENIIGTPIDTDLATDIANLALGLIAGSGQCDSGSTTTCVDAARTEADADYWAKGIAIRFTSGTMIHQSACVYDFDEGTDTMTFRPAMTQAVDTNEYILIIHPTCGGVVAP